MNNRKNEQDARAFALACALLRAARDLVSSASAHVGRSTPSKHGRDLFHACLRLEDAASEVANKAQLLRNIADGYEEP